MGNELIFISTTHQGAGRDGYQALYNVSFLIQYVGGWHQSCETELFRFTIEPSISMKPLQVAYGINNNVLLIILQGPQKFLLPTSSRQVCSSHY